MRAWGGSVWRRCGGTAVFLTGPLTVTVAVTINVAATASTPVPASLAGATPTPIPNVWAAPATSGWGLAALAVGMLAVMVIALRLTLDNRRAS